MTGIILHDLVGIKDQQYSIFDDPVRIVKTEKLFSSLDSLAEKYGKHTLHTASSLIINRFEQHIGSRGDQPQRRKVPVLGEYGRKRLRLPYFFAKV